MEFLTPKKPPSSFPRPPADAHQQGRSAEASGGGPVITSCLHLRGSPREEGEDRGRRALDRDLVLRRIRHHRRASQIREGGGAAAAAAAQTTSLRLAGGEMWRGGWMDEDAFSSP